MRGPDKVNILLIDDQPAKLLTYEAMLSDMGENLIKAFSPTEALEHLLKNEIAVILMDVNMPGMDGFELASVIRQHPRYRDIAIIFVSAVHLTDLDRLTGYQRGAVDYIPVPVVPEVLRAKVAIFIDLYRKSRLLEGLNRDLERRVLERTERLRESEGQFQTLANSIPQLAWMANSDGVRFWHNQRWYDYTGASPQEMEGDGWLNYCHPDYVDRVVSEVRHARAMGKDWEYTGPIRGREGQYRWFLSRAVPILDSHKKIVRWFGTATDVTVQIEAEERIQVLNRTLKEQIAELETVMQVLPVGVGISQDPECRVITANGYLHEMLGMEEGANISKTGECADTLPFEVFQNGNSVPPNQLPMQRAVKTQSPVAKSELEVRRRDGKIVHLLVSASPLFDDLGNVRGAVAAHFDISERRAMENLLRERADLMELASEAIVVRDRQGLVRYWNSGAEILYGWKREEILNRHLHNTLETKFPEDSLAIEQALERTGRWEGNLIQRSKDGRELTVVCRKAFSREGAKRTGTILEILHDITDQLRMQEVLRRTEKLAAMGRVAGIIAHEINNPLEAITNAMYLLSNHPSLDPEARGFAQMANAELLRLAHITRQTLSFYRESHEAVPVLVGQLLEDVLDLHSTNFKKNGISVDLEQRSASVIFGFPGELKQVFLNLVENAIQAMAKGGQLRIHVYDSTEYKGQRKGVRISISDTGGGIDPEHSERIFEPFFTTKSMKGTGLGLWISQGIVQKYEGTVRFRSVRRPNRGITCFSVFLPVLHIGIEGVQIPVTPRRDVHQSSLWESQVS